MVTTGRDSALRAYLLVAVGGSIGALARYAVGSLTHGSLGTFMANVSGAFLLGYISAVGAHRLALSLDMRRCISVGMLGSYTTFSALSYDTLRMIQNGNIAGAAANGLGSMLAGLLAVAAGVWLARRQGCTEH